MTLQELQKRHSVRAFTDEPLDAKLRNALKAEATMTTSYEAGLDFHLTFDDSTPFKAFSRSYGIFNNVNNYLTVVADLSYPDAMERAGYFAQRFVMKAVCLGLGTCYVGGTYESEGLSVFVKPGEQLLFLVVFGHPLQKERFAARMMMRLVHRNDRSPAQFFDGNEEELKKAMEKIPWLYDGLQAVACAPSALNKQPVRIAADVSQPIAEVRAFVDTKNRKNLIDLGIAKFNFAAVCNGEWEWGNNAPFFRNSID